MNNKMTVREIKTLKTFVSALMAIVLILCVGLVFVGCGNDYIKYDDAIQIAKEDFGCKKILWAGDARCNRSLTSIQYNSDGELFFEEKLLPDEGGYYVFGLDKNGNEVYVVVPRYISSTRKPTKIDWPFDYTFTEMLDFAGQFGYKYADGIDGRIDEFLGERYSLGMYARGRADEVEETTYASLYCESLGGAFCDRLDIPFVFTFQTHEDKYIYYVIGQIDGKLMMVEAVSEEMDNPTVYTYSRDGADD